MTTIMEQQQANQNQQQRSSACDDEGEFPPIHAHIHQEDLLKEVMQKRSTSAKILRAVQRTSTVLAHLSPRRLKRSTSNEIVGTGGFPRTSMIECGSEIFMPDLGDGEEIILTNDGNSFNLDLMM